jgi:hypothetical protein
MKISSTGASRAAAAGSGGGQGDSTMPRAGACASAADTVQASSAAETAEAVR